MNLSISGHQLEITASLKDHIEKKFKKLTNHFDHLIDAKFTLSVEKLNHVAEATIHLPKADLHAISTDENMYHAIELVINKLDRQVIKFKEKTFDHHQLDGSIKRKID